MSELPKVMQPSKLFEVDQTIKVRVLHVDEEKRLIYCTCKRSLLKEDINVLSDLASVSTDLMYPGTCFAVNQYGVQVKFFNNIFGFISSSEMQRRHIDSEGFVKGRVVRCRVLRVDKARNRLDVIPWSAGQVEESEDVVGLVTSGVVVKEKYHVTMNHETVMGVVIHTENDLYGFLPVGCDANGLIEGKPDGRSRFASGFAVLAVQARRACE